MRIMNTMCPSGLIQWQEYLARFSAGTPPDPATEDQLRAAERRLGIRLPLSLRTFLSCSNGWRNRDALFGLSSAEELRWTNDPAHDLVDLWSSFEEVIEPITGCLVVLDSGDGRYGLVDPTRIGADGEWTAYAWAARDGQTPRPFPSFSALVTAIVGEELPGEEPAA